MSACDTVLLVISINLNQQYYIDALTPVAITTRLRIWYRVVIEVHAGMVRMQPAPIY